MTLRTIDNNWHWAVLHDGNWEQQFRGTFTSQPGAPRHNRHVYIQWVANNYHFIAGVPTKWEKIGFRSIDAAKAFAEYNFPEWLGYTTENREGLR